MADDIKLVVGVDYSDLTGLIKTTDQTKRALGSVAKDFARTGSQEAYMRGINQIVNAQNKLDSASRMSRSEIMKLGNQLKQEAQFADALAKSTNRLGAAYGFAGKKINRMGVGLQQAGYQVGDFAVQVQGGTNAAVALGQQGSQLLGIFGPAGALAGAALAIGTAIVAPLMKANKEAKSLIATIEGFTESYQTKLDMLKFGVDTEEEAKAQAELLKLRKTDLDLRRQMAQTDSLSTRQRLSEELRANSLILSETRAVVEANKEKREQYELAVALSQSEVQEAENLRANQQRVNRERVKGEKEWLAGTADRLAKRNNFIEYYNKLLDKQQERLDEIKDWEDGSADRLAKRNNFMEYYNKLLDEQIKKEEQAAEARSKIAFPDLGTSDAMMAILYQEYGQSRANAPKTQPKDKTPTKPKAEKDPLAELRKRITLEEELIGKTEAQSQVIQALGVNYQQVYGKAATDQVIDRINKIKELQDEEARLEDTARAIGSAMEDSFTSMIDGTSSVKDAFRDMARDIVAHLFKVLVIQRAIRGIGGALAGSSNAAVADIGGALQSYDGGGYTGSGPRSGGMDGRGGRLAVIHPRETVIDHTKAGSGSGEQIVINQSFNFSANGDDSVKKLIAQAAPQIASMTQKQIMDSRRRGGSMKATFG